YAAHKEQKIAPSRGNIIRVGKARMRSACWRSHVLPPLLSATLNHGVPTAIYLRCREQKFQRSEALTEMSAFGHYRTQTTSALPLKADIRRHAWIVRSGPIADIRGSQSRRVFQHKCSTK